MLRHRSLDHRFVQHLPDALDPGVLYVSMEYGTASHSCCCGCGEEVVTPFSPTDWRMTFDGEAVSLHPSVGNWNLRCRSHYVLDRGRVVEAGPWSDEQVQAGRKRDKADKARFYRDRAKPVDAKGPTSPMPLAAGGGGWLARAWRRLWGG